MSYKVFQEPREFTLKVLYILLSVIILLFKELYQIIINTIWGKWMLFYLKTDLLCRLLFFREKRRGKGE